MAREPQSSSASRLARWALVGLLAAAVLMAAAGAGESSSRGAVAASAAVPRAAASGAYFDYVVIILMENHNLCDIYTHCGGTGTYETSLADTYGIPLQYHYCNVNPSLPNYLCLTGGSSFGCTSDDNPDSSACTQAAWASPNVVDRLETGGLTWKAYMEDMPSNCDGSNSGNYAVRHDPFVYFSDIASSSSRCARVVPAGPSAGSDATFLGDLASTTTASSYMWLTPNTCNDMHDCSIATGDTYLSNLVPQILNSNVFATQRAALFIAFDEGYGPPTFAEWAGPAVKHAFTSNTTYTHFSFLKTLEENWNLPALNATNDGAATGMGEFFTGATGPDFSLTANPAVVSFETGASGTTAIHLASLRGFNGTVALTTESSPAGVQANCTPAFLHGSDAATCTLTSSAVGSYQVTVKGANDSLAHSTTVSVTVASPSLLGPYGTVIILAVVVVAAVAVVAILLRRRRKGTPPA